MEQINRGILLRKQFAANAHVKATRMEVGMTREEPIFDALLGQKNEQYSNKVEEQPKKSETVEDTQEKEVNKSETPTDRGDEEETCDVAREVAAAQIVWLIEPNAVHLKVEVQPEKVATIERPMIISTNDEPTKSLEDLVGSQMENLVSETEELVVTEPVVTENLQEVVQVDDTDNEQSNNDFDASVDMDMEIKVTTTDSEETNGEAVVVETPLFEGVETTPIKVAEAPERTEESAPVNQQVVEKLSTMMENGETKVQIQLEPVELGKLTIELTRSADGTLTVLLDAENSQTRSLLEKHMDSLQEALADRGQKMVQITVEHNEESQRQENHQRDDFYDGQNGQQQEQQQQRRDTRHNSIDFMQQLRLGLIPLEEEEDV